MNSSGLAEPPQNVHGLLREFALASRYDKPSALAL